jgi:hypothetical protein
MRAFTDIIGCYVGIIEALNGGKVTLHSPLEEMVLRGAGDNLAYIDNRGDAKRKYRHDLWGAASRRFRGEKRFLQWIRSQNISRTLLYSKSEQFPDFMFKVAATFGTLLCGSVLELKDSKGGSIASFNSTLPTRCKTLEEIDIVNGKNLVSRIASLMDGDASSLKEYYTFNRRCFYLVRTHAGNKRKVKISIVDGSFFETVPKEHLIYQMFLNILRSHLEKHKITVSPDAVALFEQLLPHITDQTIIASSQMIEKASVRPRLRIMAEVHPEGNPHSTHYPEIGERSFNLIVSASAYDEEVANSLLQEISELRKFSIRHKRNGEHIVFEFKY